MKLFKSFVILAILLASSAGQSKSSLTLDITKPPSKAEWKYFMSTSVEFKEGLWQTKVQQKKKLSDWSWGWRMGWIQTCKEARTKWCTSILLQGATDSAALVRSSAIKTLGKKYAHSKNKELVNFLKKEDAHKRNNRNGKPLFVRKDIARAIANIENKKM